MARSGGANKGIFAQGVNFNAKGQVGAYSDGNIYVQGTKDRIHEIFNSHTVKRFGGVKYGSKHDYVNSKIERYRHTQLYGEAGITLDSEGKLRVEGADVQSYGNVLLRGKQGVEILPGEEINSRYEEHTSKSIKASLNAGWNGISAGVGYQKTEDRISELTKNVISNNIQAGGDVEIRSEEGNITMGPTDGFVGGKLKLDGNDIDIIDAHSERIIDTVSKKTYIGVGVTAGIPVIGAAKQLIDAGRAIGKSKHKEDYLNSGFGAFNAGMGAMNAFGNLFTSPMATSASLNYSKSQDSYHREERISVGSRLHVKGGVEYNGKNLHTVNLNMLNEGDTVYNITGNIIREAGKSTIKESTGSRGYGLSLAKGSDGMNPFKGNGTTVIAGTSGSKGKSEGVYYTNPKDETKGNSHYNVGGDVKDSGVDIKTGSISGKIEGNHTVESLQDTFDSRNRGYSISTGIGINSTKGNKGTTYNTNIHSVSAGHSQGKTVQRITREVSEFTAGSGMLEVKGETRQIGSLIDGGFTLNTGGYSKEDLHDVNKTRNVGVNITVYPNTVYSKRDKNGKKVYVNGKNPKEKGVAIGIGISYMDIDKKRDVVATVGNGVNINHDISGVNRDPNRQKTEFEGREITGVNVNLGTEYWLTAAGRGKTRDIIEDAGETADGIRRMLTWKDENGNLALLKNIKSESHLRELERRGFTDLEGKTLKEIQKEVEEKFGDLGEKGIKVRFFDKNDIDTSNLTKDQIKKLLADGFATTGDGYIWLNKERLENGNTVDINGVIQHEITHQVMGEDSEHEARYVEDGYVDFLKGVKKAGYLTDGEIVDYNVSSLNTQDKERLGRYVDSDMQYKIFLDKKLTDKERNVILALLQKITNNKLKIEKTCPLKDCYEVVFDKGKGNTLQKINKNIEYVKSDRLILDLIATEKEVWITNERNPSKFFTGEAQNQETYYSGKAYVILSFKSDSINKEISTLIDGKMVREKRPLFIGLGHELSHMHHYHFNPTKIANSIEYTYLAVDSNGKLTEYRASMEELRTVGISKLVNNKNLLERYKNGAILYFRPNDITENDIRREHELPYRNNY